MEKISILGYYTTPDCDLKMSNKLYNLLRQTINNEILAKYKFPRVKSTVFEILIDTEVETNNRRVIQLSKTGRGKYFSFRFFLPYNVVTENKKLNIVAFINEFMEGIRTALSQFNEVPDEHLDHLKEQLIAETKGKTEYEHVKTDHEIATEKVMKKFRELRKAGEI